MIIIGLSGKARTGKSRLSKELYNAAEKLGWDVFVKPFAGPLKKYVSEELGYTKENNPQKYREHCQKIGAEKRQEDPDHWVSLWYKDMLSEYSEEMQVGERPSLYLVDDVRYPNELKILKSPKVKATLLFVKPMEREIEDPQGEWRSHESEKVANKLDTLDDDVIKERHEYDFVIHNDKPEEQLQKWAVNFINFLSSNDPCLCEACIANYEMRAPDADKIDEELKKFLDEIPGEDDD
tara:strand:- start:18523 stop:19233 length:711 start_codon:yes stop_codon:yes gene_type:complete